MKAYYVDLSDEAMQSIPEHPLCQGRVHASGSKQKHSDALQVKPSSQNGIALNRLPGVTDDGGG